MLRFMIRMAKPEEKDENVPVFVVIFEEIRKASTGSLYTRTVSHVISEEAFEGYDKTLEGIVEYVGKTYNKTAGDSEFYFEKGFEEKFRSLAM